MAVRERMFAVIDARLALIPAAMSAADCSAGSQIISQPRMRPVIGGSPSWRAKKAETCSIQASSFTRVSLQSLQS